LAARREAQRQEVDLDALLPRHRVGDRLGELGLSGADVAAENYKRRPAQHGVDEPAGAGVMPRPPALQAAWMN